MIRALACAHSPPQAVTTALRSERKADEDACDPKKADWHASCDEEGKTFCRRIVKWRIGYIATLMERLRQAT
ncbi:hypothetical protein [Labrys sp. 22185]|uniref:hypothetical protein n=1 Tax=Labrys sp. 22185 TaxID=3453888 RepID=UPI003F853C18